MKCGSCLLSTFESENGSFSFSRYRSKYQALLTRHSGNILVMLLFFPAPLPTFSLSYLTQICLQFCALEDDHELLLLLPPLRTWDGKGCATAEDFPWC